MCEKMSSRRSLQEKSKCIAGVSLEALPAYKRNKARYVIGSQMFILLVHAFISTTLEAFESSCGRTLLFKTSITRMLKVYYAASKSSQRF